MAAYIVYDSLWTEPQYKLKLSIVCFRVLSPPLRFIFLPGRTCARTTWVGARARSTGTSCSSATIVIT